MMRFKQKYLTTREVYQGHSSDNPSKIHPPSRWWFIYLFKLQNTPVPREERILNYIFR